MNDISNSPVPGNASPCSLAPDFEQASAYVAALTGGDAQTAIIDIRAIHDTDKGIEAIAMRGTLLEIWPQVRTLQQLGYGLFMNINPLDGQGRQLQNVQHIRAHCVDLDNLSSQQNYERAAAWTPAPSFAVQSSDGRFHVYWTVQPYTDNAVFTETQRKLRTLFDGDPSIIDPTRVMRLPGTINFKRETPHAVTCWALSGFGQRYPVQQLGEALAGVAVIEGHHGRKDLGDPALAAPSIEWLDRAFALCDPNTLTSRQDWLAISAAFKQSGWSLLTELELRARWDQWCSRYDTDDLAENSKLWHSIKNSETGWSSLVSRIPTLKGELIFGGKDRSSELPPAITTVARPYDDMLNDAAKLLPDDADGIAALCREAATLSEIHCETLLKAIHIATGVRLQALRREAAQQAKKAEPDHLVMARMTISEIGQGNIIHADEHFWLWDDGGVWKKRDTIAVKQQVQGTIERSGYPVTAAKVSGVTDVTKSELYRPDHTFNIGNADVVNCRNGELELINAAWALHPHRRENYRTTQIPVAHDQAAEAPMFWEFIHAVFRDDPDRDDKVRSVLELIGYTLMSHAKHEKFVMLIGGGANGKSVLLSVIEALVGLDNVAGVQPGQFDSKWQRAHLHMKLANIVTELRQGEVIADAELKAITSGELTTVEFKNGQPFNMRAFATCWFGTNHLPHTRDFSDALFRRATILTFNRTFAPSEQDHNLKTKLKEELPGILRYALTYYAHAIASGFIEPASSQEAKRKWRMEADQVAQFVEERCVDDPVGRIAVSVIYQQFRDWAINSGIRQIVGKQALGDRLERLGYGRLHSGQRFITGLKITHNL